MVTIMASKAHRWVGDTPLTDFHGGTKEAAKHAVQEAKRRQFASAKEAAREVLEDACRANRKDRVRRRVALRLVQNDLAPPYLADVPVMVRGPYRDPGPPAMPHATLVWDRCGGNCTYCGQPMMRMQNEPMSFSIDHAIPRSRGGTHHLENLVGACRRCNGDKGSLTREEYEAVLEVRRPWG